MGLVTSQQLAKYYNSYKEREITFNRQIIDVLNLLPREVFLKNRGEQLPCVIYSSSMVGAKIVANLKAGTLQQIRNSGNTVSLRFAFARNDKAEPLYFFTPAKVANYSFYNKEKPDLFFLSLEYTSKPPDDLIEMLGQLFDTHANYTRRKDERIELNPSIIKHMGIESKEATIVIEKQARKCIIRDLSFSGAKVLLFGAATEHVEQTVALHFALNDAQRQHILIPGTVVRFEEVVGRDDIGAFGIRFQEEKIPMSYKMLINSTLRTNRTVHE